MFDWVSSPEAWVALTTLVGLEIVLGIDNIIFISILVARLPVEQRHLARQLGLGLAMITRLALLFGIVWVMSLVKPWFSVFEYEISGRDIVLILGGMFLIAKSTREIHNSLEIIQDTAGNTGKAGFVSVLVQIALLDIIFSLDSVITAVGLVEHVTIMVIAILASVGVMLFAAKSIGAFIDSNPTIKMLALSFLLMIGFTLVAEGFDVHVPKGYIYFAMAFSVSVEILNIRVRRRKQSEVVHLNKKVADTNTG